jgi:hypothetical protein
MLTLKWSNDVHHRVWDYGILVWEKIVLMSSIAISIDISLIHDCQYWFEIQFWMKKTCYSNSLRLSYHGFTITELNDIKFYVILGSPTGPNQYHWERTTIWGRPIRLTCNEFQSVKVSAVKIVTICQNSTSFKSARLTILRSRSPWKLQVITDHTYRCIGKRL